MHGSNCSCIRDKSFLHGHNCSFTWPRHGQLSCQWCMCILTAIWLHALSKDKCRVPWCSCLLSTCAACVLSTCLFSVMQDEVAEAAAAEWEEAVAAAAVYGGPPGGPMRGEPLGTPYALPRIALMFLTRGPMPHELTWRAFLGTIPRAWPLTCAFGCSKHAPARGGACAGAGAAPGKIRCNIAWLWGQALRQAVLESASLSHPLPAPC